MSVVLGISAYHPDAAAALVVDGRLAAAVAEERFTRVKHWAGFPAASIRSCLETAGVPPRKGGRLGLTGRPILYEA